MGKPTVFISYSHKDEKWKDWLLPQLRVLEMAGRIIVWDDRKIDQGDQWYDEIIEAMDDAAVTICLISPDYLASDFIAKEEIPYLLERRKRDGMALNPVLLRPCHFELFSWLSPTQMLPRDGKSVSEDFKGKEDGVFAEVADEVLKILDDPNYTPPKPPSPKWSPPEAIDITRLPQTGAELFGRQSMLESLDKAWEDENLHVISLVAWGGVGKSTLINKWVERMAADNYRGARRVFGWSFYSQGTSEQVTSADLFIAEALAWFGDPEPDEGSPWAKGERLAALVRKEKTLLLLDGMEPLQSPHDFERGKINDPALAVLVTELARDNPGVCLITTRERVPELDDFAETARQENLEQISAQAGRALLRVGGVRGTDAELEQATGDFGNHALALNLLTAYLRDVSGHPISHTATIPDLDVPEEKGKHPRRVMAAFAERFGEGPEVELLRVLGLFDRPAESDAIAAVRADPPIPDLTAHLQALPAAGWLQLLAMLRAARLLAEESSHRPGDLDAHPRVREHFGAQLQDEYPEAWRAGNNRLYEYFKGAAPDLPDTLEEMAPLFTAVAHGCAAGRHQNALDEVYRRRISRGKEHYSTQKLGAIGADLAALSNFFDVSNALPWAQPVAGITENFKAGVLNWAGFRLRALGRLAEATQPMQAGLNADIEREDWKNAAIAAGNLSELQLTLGDVAAAVKTAEQCVELADRSGDAFSAHEQAHHPGRRAAPGRAACGSCGGFRGSRGAAKGEPAGVPATLLATGLSILRPAAEPGGVRGSASAGCTGDRNRKAK